MKPPSELEWRERDRVGRASGRGPGGAREAGAGPRRRGPGGAGGGQPRLESGRFVRGLTFSGTPAACFVGLQVFGIMRGEGLFTRPAEIGAVLMRKLRGLAARHEVIGRCAAAGS